MYMALMIFFSNKPFPDISGHFLPFQVISSHFHGYIHRFVFLECYFDFFNKFLINI